MLKFHNTLTKKVEEFIPRDPKKVTVYCCGPTVYDYAHIGNFRTYTMSDLLVRTLKYVGYTVRYVMNVTDVGHLVSDADEGEDKMEKGAKREGKTAWDIAKFYTDAFLRDSKNLNLLEPDVRPKPTDHIPEQIDMVQTLIKKGFAYTTDDGVYYDTSKFSGYGALTGQSLNELKEGARVEPNPQKRNPTDFALWKFSPPVKDTSGRVRKRDMEWESPFVLPGGRGKGLGFPGWHIECSAMSRKHLGDQIDIHTGGADLIPIHHTNEIAQSEAASGKSPFVRYWVHGQFIMVDGEKMSKSKGNFYRLADVEAKIHDPLALRYFYMTAQYRAFLNFTWEGLEAAQHALSELRGKVSLLQHDNTSNLEYSDWSKGARNLFQISLEEDLNLPKALRVVWNVAKHKLDPREKYKLLMEFDRVLGLDLDRESLTPEAPSEDIQELVKRREALRQKKMFGEADELRKQIEEKGYEIEDTASGIRVKKVK
ncbi:cysteine--tRNA ligase [Candidatus Gottesmanbacteria bacterium RIFCSPLOWO2_01_FULL_46_9]|uniref:Cysteine--tRNA ligase n=1 Tax=Candidatus Gottesmanbacteria bacterium RIFCSPLOWO2_01_FULL_46_9 TaxID=1798394 RepID=A0A1F6B056_9BACT|nr:MAG: cysteine--tRNA ligase [Candidatus Gottesmanbacteria bacterium RIFCSPLOWO2_01_FULL_46_9]